MLKEGKVEEIRNITNHRSIVFRDGVHLKAIDYVDYFNESFIKIANELKQTTAYSKDKNFIEYLKL